MDRVLTKHRAVVQRIARRAMIERDLLSDFSLAALSEHDRNLAPALRTEVPLSDLRRLSWCLIQLIHTNIERGFIVFGRVC